MQGELSRAPTRVTDRQALRLGAAGGPALVAVAYLVLLQNLPTGYSSWILAAPLTVPLILTVPFALTRRRRPALMMLAGSVVGVCVMMGLIVGVITLVAYGLSDPIPAP